MLARHAQTGHAIRLDDAAEPAAAGPVVTARINTLAGFAALSEVAERAYPEAI